VRKDTGRKRERGGEGGGNRSFCPLSLKKKKEQGNHFYYLSQQQKKKRGEKGGGGRGEENLGSVP